MTIAAQLHAERKRAGLTQAQAAVLCGVGLRTYHGWEAGRGARSVGPYEALERLKREPTRRAA